MSNRYKGGVISATPPTLVAGAGASGTWTLEQQMQATAAGLWPVNGPFYIEDVFSTWLYTGNGSTQTINNGINLAGKGGLVWVKGRQYATNNGLTDTARGITNYLFSDDTMAQYSYGAGTGITAFNANGFSVGRSAGDVENGADQAYVSWTFRDQPKFFDVVTYTGDGSGATLQVPHNLGSKPGCIIIKRTNASGNWGVLHQGNNVAYTAAWTGFSLNNGSNSNFYGSTLNLSSAVSDTFFRPHNVVDVSGGRFNVSGATYVAYLFAHNAGGFGLTGTDNVISCGSYTGTGAAGNAITLGYEPQWLLVKNVLGAQNWEMFDNMRGLPTGGASSELFPNTSSAERTAFNIFNVTATGFVTGTSALDETNASGNTYIYIAIRRGPMKVPTTGTSVFAPLALANSVNTQNVTGFPIDLQIRKARSAVFGNPVYDRLRGMSSVPSSTSIIMGPVLYSNATTAEATSDDAGYLYDNTSFRTGQNWQGSTAYWNFGRAPGFFDEVCYTGDSSSSRNISHNLQVVPELLIIKSRNNGTRNWGVLHSYDASGLSVQFLNLTNASSVVTYGGNSVSVAAPTSTIFNVGSSQTVNGSAENYVAYLFATCPGVSKVGSYTGTAATQTINCGFTGGARFVLIKRTDSTGDWYVWDSARGIVAGNDPYLLLNSTAAEVTNTDYVDTAATGFEISSTAPAAINASGGTFIFLAIA